VQLRRARRAQKRDARRDVDAARLAALIDVAVEAQVSAEAENVRAADYAQIVQELGYRHCAEGAGRVIEWLVDRSEIEGRNSRETLVGFALREGEDETRITHRKFVDHAR